MGYHCSEWLHSILHLAFRMLLGNTTVLNGCIPSSTWYPGCCYGMPLFWVVVYHPALGIHGVAMGYHCSEWLYTILNLVSRVLLWDTIVLRACIPSCTWYPGCCYGMPLLWVVVYHTAHGIQGVAMGYLCSKWLHSILHMVYQMLLGDITVLSVCISSCTWYPGCC